MASMAHETSFDTTMSKEGRVVIPAELRRALGVKAGDVLHLSLEGASLKVTTSHALMAEVWANNSGEPTGDAGADVRAFRDGDTALDNARHAALADTPADPLTEDALADDLLSRLGLAG